MPVEPVECPQYLIKRRASSPPVIPALTANCRAADSGFHSGIRSQVSPPCFAVWPLRFPSVSFRSQR